jgi:hypothetical protein
MSALPGGVWRRRGGDAADDHPVSAAREPAALTEVLAQPRLLPIPGDGYGARLGSADLGLGGGCEGGSGRPAERASHRDRVEA